MLLQILRFHLLPSLTISCQAFTDLRKQVALAGATHQYFGYSVQTSVAPLPKERHEITWIMRWPVSPELLEKPHLERAFAELSQKDPSSLLVDVASNDDKELLAGLTAPVCEITYTDCYRMQGFTGGDWGYTLNTNLVGGERDVLPGSWGSRLESKDRKLAIYLLGWESIELHEDANKTPVFAEEMVKLGPWISQESGAWYVRFAT
ncbi:hypothetical protein FOC1_g10001689 [Fusarium oxysporum f. sp. cubense race 1]|uniref:Uncharacterized protein n=1 Tax=Fusarium oxysporum f. sp. cubense (strain race 1) TaxID=1229664 RepID=N4UA70_FUSC1|nr:hypothetical protein FOC1_g10001689 [Fusarium oxysporum f. sp. cubense race 1]